MSRCFPFPPPGYEKKARPDDDSNILIKEKHKEKKHKKDKDKEKKEKREKNDKEKSSEKKREKKDRKRKHKDKNKNKEKEEKEDLEEKKVVTPSSDQNGEKLGSIGKQNHQLQHGGLVLELGKKVGDENRPRETRSFDKSSVKEYSVVSSGKELESSRSVVSSGKELESGRGIVVEENQKFKDNREETRVPNGQSIAKHLENGFLGNILAKEQRIVEGAICQEEVSKKRKERKDKRKSSESKGDKHKDGDRERKSKSKDKEKKREKMKGEKVKEISTLVQSEVIENGNNAVHIQNHSGSNIFKGSNSNNGNLGKRKEPEMNGFLHGNRSPVSKLPRPLSSSKVEQNGTRNGASNPGIQFAMEKKAALVKHKLDSTASFSSSVPENGTKLDNRQTANNYAPERQVAINNHHHKVRESLSSLQPSLGIGKKLERGQTAVNSVIEVQGVVMDHKWTKKDPSLTPIAENERKLDSSQCSMSPSAGSPGAVSQVKLVNQETKSNDLDFRKPDACSVGPSPVADQLKDTLEAHTKPTHPDAKYLATILSVPKVEWSDIDDQAWLLAVEDRDRKKPKIDSTTSESSKQVWAEALLLESADVTALPYVIPY